MEAEIVLNVECVVIAYGEDGVKHFRDKMEAANMEALVLWQ